MKSNRIFSLFIPHYGCKNKCIYCNQNFAAGFVSEKYDFDNQLENLKKYKNDITEIGIYSGNFTGLNLTQQKFILNALNEITNFLIPIRISTRPDYIDETIIKILKEQNVKTIELGLQTANEKILKLLGRNYSLEQVIKTNCLLKENNFKISYHIMLGLPEESDEDFYTTVKFVLHLTPDFVRIHPTVILKNTELHKMYLEGNFTPISLEKAIELSLYGYTSFKKAGIDIIKIGLQSEKSLTDNIAAGPYHPAFAQLVKSRYILMQIIDIIKSRADNFDIIINKKNESIIKGQKKDNLLHLKFLGLNQIIIDNSLKEEIIKIKTKTETVQIVI